MQRGFIAVFEKLKSFKGKGELGAWIRMIIVRKCIDLIKERKQLKYEDLENIDQHLIESAELNHTYNEINYSELVLLLDHMPLGYKTVFSMYILDGLQHKEIAEALDISVATSRSQLYKARKMMMELVQTQFKKSGMQQYQS